LGVQKGYKSHIHSCHSFYPILFQEYEKENISMMSSKLNQRNLAFINLAIVYVVWGSTYLAIRIAVRGDGAWPPFMLGATRVLCGGIILVLLAKLQGERFRISKRDLLTLFCSGTLMWVIGNGIVNWGEQFIDSGLTALIIGTAPLSMALMEAIINKKAPTLRLVIALMIGFLGLVVLTIPLLNEGMQGETLAVILIVLSVMSWNGGMLLQQIRPVSVSPIASSGIQQISASIGFFIMSLFMGEKIPSPSPQAWMAWGYLVVFGSLIAFTSYVNVLRTLPAQIAITTAYVNPVIALFLGWLILKEEITLYSIFGMAMILLAVFVVFQDRLKIKKKNGDD